MIFAPHAVSMIPCLLLPPDLPDAVEAEAAEAIKASNMICFS